MSFGLISIPATLQTLVNQVFEPYLSKFVLVFYEILIYSFILESHVAHLGLILSVLKDIDYTLEF